MNLTRVKKRTSVIISNTLNYSTFCFRVKKSSANNGKILYFARTVIQIYCWFHISFKYFNRRIYVSVKYSPTQNYNVKSIFNYFFSSRLSQAVNTVIFKRENFISNWKYCSVSKELALTVFNGDINSSTFKMLPNFSNLMRNYYQYYWHFFRYQG